MPGRACMAGGACMARGVCGWGVHAMHAFPQPDTMRYGQSMRGQYASYWNAFLSCFITCNMNKMLIPNYNKLF